MKQKQIGFGLIELLIAIATLTILLSLAIPGYGNFSRSAKLASISNGLVASLAFARNTSIQRGIRVTLCKTANAGTDNPSCQSAAKWSDGWIIFVDTASIGIFDGSDILLRAHSLPSSDTTVTTSNFANYVSYLASGRSKAANGLSNGTISFCMDGKKHSVILNVTGRVRVDRSVC